MFSKLSVKPLVSPLIKLLVLFNVLFIKVSSRSTEYAAVVKIRDMADAPIIKFLFHIDILYFNRMILQINIRYGALGRT